MQQVPNDYDAFAAENLKQVDALIVQFFGEETKEEVLESLDDELPI